MGKVEEKFLWQAQIPQMRTHTGSLDYGGEVSLGNGQISRTVSEQETQTVIRHIASKRLVSLSLPVIQLLARCQEHQIALSVASPFRYMVLSIENCDGVITTLRSTQASYVISSQSYVAGFSNRQVQSQSGM